MSQKHLKLMGWLAISCAMLASTALCGQYPKTAEQDKADSGFEFGEFSGPNSDTAVVASASSRLLAKGKPPISREAANRRTPPSPLGPPLNLRSNDNDLDAKRRNWFVNMLLAGAVIGGALLAVGIKSEAPLVIAAGLMVCVGSFIGFGPDRWASWGKRQRPV